MQAKIRASKSVARSQKVADDVAEASPEKEQGQTEDIAAPLFASQQLDNIGRVSSPGARQNLMRSIGETYGNNRAATIARQIAHADAGVQRAPATAEAGVMSEAAQSAALKVLTEGIAAGQKGYGLYDKAFWAAHPEMQGKAIGAVSDTATRNALKADYKYIIDVLYPQAKATPQAAPAAETSEAKPAASVTEPDMLDSAMQSASSVMSGIADTVSGAWDSFTGWLGGGTTTETPTTVAGTPTATPGAETPASTEPAPVEQPAATAELSGAQWVSRYQDPRSLDSMNDDIRDDAKAFVKALQDAGATVTISSTVRPKQRSYLMYWASKIAFATDPEAQAALAQADTDEGSVASEITWSHGDATKTKAAAKAMCDAYQIGKVVARHSNHNGGGAMDISISWSKKLTIKGKDGSDIESIAESGVIKKATTDPDKGILKAGRSYGIYNYYDTTNGSSRTGQDGVHWSRSGG